MLVHGRPQRLEALAGRAEDFPARTIEIVVPYPAGDGSDRVTAWRTVNGDLAWTTDHLRYRGLSGFLLIGRTAVAGDFEGQVHFLSKTNGQPVLRLPTDGSRVVSQPVLAGTTLLVVTAKGGVFAFRPE